MSQSSPRWLLYLPTLLRNRIEHRSNLQAILSNTGWLFADKVLRMGVGLFVGVWVARYLGPEQFGLWNFTIAFSSLFSIFATLGLDGVVIRELVKNPERQNELLGTAFVLRLTGAMIAILLALTTIFLMRGGETLTLSLVFLSITGYIFQSVNVIDFYFQSKVKSKYTVYAASLAFVLVTIIKIILLLTAAPLIVFAIAGLCEVVLTTAFLILVYKIKHQNICEWRFNVCLAKKLLIDCWPLILAGAASMINMRMDQVMLGNMTNNIVVGNYAAAIRISEIWFILPGVIGASIYPSLISAKQLGTEFYRKKVITVIKCMCIFAIPFATLVSLLSDSLITILYGDKYKEAGIYLAIQIWSGLPYLTLFVYSQVALIDSLTKIAFYISIYTVILNTALNYILIPIYGGVGAAVVTLLVAWVSVFLTVFLVEHKVNIFISRGR